MAEETRARERGCKIDTMTLFEGGEDQMGEGMFNGGRSYSYGWDSFVLLLDELGVDDRRVGNLLILRRLSFSTW